MTADRSWNGRYFPVMGVGLIAVALIATGCTEKRRFAKEGATKETRKLVVPARITPPVTVARIEGTPEAWQLNQRVAKALRDRDVPAGAKSGGKSPSGASYRLTGRAERLAPAAGTAAPRLRIAWTLLDAKGKRVGTVTQTAAHPVAADAKLDANIDRKPDPVALDRMARIAAERLTPLMPHTAVKRAQTASAAGATGANAAQGTRRSDSIWRRIVGAPVTALGKQDARRGSSGLSARFLRLRNVSTVPPRAAAAAKPAGEAGAKAKPAEAVAKVKQERANDAPVVKPAAATGSALDRRSVVTERIAHVAGPRRAKVTPAAARTGSPRTGTVRKSTAIRPAPGRAKFAAAGGGRARTVQVAEAGGEREAKPAKAYWVQLASNPNPKASRAAWQALVAAHGELLERQPYAINRANLGSKGVYYRLQLGPYPNIAQAKRICASLQKRRVPCLLMAARGQVAARDRTTRKTETKPAPPASKSGKTKGETREAPAPKSRAQKAKPPKSRKPAPKAATKPRGGRTAAGEASAVKPAAGAVKPGAKSGAAGGRAERSVARKPAAGANEPKSRADKLPFQRSRALPGLPD